MANRLERGEEEIVDLLDDGYDHPDEARRAARNRLLVTIALFVTAIAATLMTIWYLVGGQPAGGGAVPLIRADTRPVKTRPDERGGMEVPNQDKLVYERIGSVDGEGKVERLMPAPEAPHTPPPPANPAPTLAAPKPPIESLAGPARTEPAKVEASRPEATKEPTRPEPPKPEPAKPVEVQKEATVPARPGSQQAAVPPLPPTAAAPKPPAPAPAPAPAKPVTAAAMLVQIGAMRSAEDADKEWRRLQRANADVLGGLRPDVQRADLGAKGVFWRLRAGPLGEDAARTLCIELSRRKIGCMVVPR